MKRAKITRPPAPWLKDESIKDLQNNGINFAVKLVTLMIPLFGITIVS